MILLNIAGANQRYTIEVVQTFSKSTETRVVISQLHKVYIGTKKKGPRGCPRHPNKEQNGANKEPNWGKKGAFWVCFLL